MPYARWQSSLSSPLWRRRSRWVPPGKAESETSSWSPWPWCWAPLRSSAWGHSCLLPAVLFSQPSTALCWTLAPDSPGRRTSPSELLHSLSSRPASQSWWKYSYRSPAALVRSQGCWETGSGRAAHIQQHHAGIFPLRATASASPLPPSSPSLALTEALPLFLSSPSFLRRQSWTPAVSFSCLLTGSFCSPVVQLNKFSSFLYLSTFPNYLHVAT